LFVFHQKTDNSTAETIKAYYQQLREDQTIIQRMSVERHQQQKLMAVERHQQQMVLLALQIKNEEAKQIVQMVQVDIPNPYEDDDFGV
jgi:hypothetical protein